MSTTILTETLNSYISKRNRAILFCDRPEESVRHLIAFYTAMDQLQLPFPFKVEVHHLQNFSNPQRLFEELDEAEVIVFATHSVPSAEVQEWLDRWFPAARSKTGLLLHLTPSGLEPEESAFIKSYFRAAAYSACRAFASTQADDVAVDVPSLWRAAGAAGKSESIAPRGAAPWEAREFKNPELSCAG